LETALRSLSGEAVEINASGRTDAGVHAMAQCASFHLETELDCELIKARLNEVTGRDIRILSIERAEPRFHARLNAKRKTYVYRIAVGDKADVFERRFVYGYPCRVDIQAMKTAASFLLGEHDFKAFCSNKRTKKSTVRTIYGIDITLENDTLTMRFTGNGFLYNMVRILSGTLLQVGTGELKASDITAILGSMDRKNAGVTLPSTGLMLESVEY
jgi:tRNA pseudouridine38-40 synthase